MSCEHKTYLVIPRHVLQTKFWGVRKYEEIQPPISSYFRIPKTVGRTVGRPPCSAKLRFAVVARSSDRMIDCSITRSIARSIVRSIDRSMGRSSDRWIAGSIASFVLRTPASAIPRSGPGQRRTAWQGTPLHVDFKWENLEYASACDRHNGTCCLVCVAFLALWRLRSSEHVQWCMVHRTSAVTLNQDHVLWTAEHVLRTATWDAVATVYAYLIACHFPSMTLTRTGFFGNAVCCSSITRTQHAHSTHRTGT